MIDLSCGTYHTSTHLDETIGVLQEKSHIGVFFLIYLFILMPIIINVTVREKHLNLCRFRPRPLFNLNFDY